jgi:hypothetical protein
MTDKQTMSQRFEAYRPSKVALFWSCAGCVVATMIVGFTWGGWVTGGTATEMAANSAETATSQVAAAVCAKNFMAGTDARAQLASLNDAESTWKRRRLLEDGGWTTVAGQEYGDAAEPCADLLMEMEAPPAQEAATTEAGTITQ